MTDSKALIERLRQLSGNTGKMTWVGDKPMTASDALTRAADHIEKLEAELDRCRKSNAVMDNTVRELEADNARLREALEHIGIYGCGMLNQPAAMNGPEEAWLKQRIFEMERTARAALQETSHDA